MKSNGKVLGILGGMGPAASADFLRLLTAYSPACCDQEQPQAILYSKTVIPNRTSFLLGKGPDPTPALIDGLEKLLEWGSDYLAVTCNTSHYYIDSFPKEIQSKLISIVDETIIAAKNVSPHGSWLTATLGTMQTNLYQNHSKRYDYTFHIPDAEMKIRIHEVTDLVKAGKNEIAGSMFKEICESLWEIQHLPIVCACTELPIVYQYAGLPENMCISSLDALARACVQKLYDF